MVVIADDTVILEQLDIEDADILLAAPIDFSNSDGLLNLWTRPEYFDVDRFVDAFGNCPAQFLQSLFECNAPGRRFGIIGGQTLNYADPPHLLGLLPVRRQRPRNRRAAEYYLNELHDRLLAQGVGSEVRIVVSPRRARSIRALAEREQNEEDKQLLLDDLATIV